MTQDNKLSPGSIIGLVIGQLQYFKLNISILLCSTAGLPCGSESSLEVGSEFLVSSRRCRGGKYPHNVRCGWKFQVGPRCLPRIQCGRLDIAGNWRRGCRGGDRLSLETENVRFNWCGQRGPVEYQESESEFLRDISDISKIFPMLEGSAPRRNVITNSDTPQVQTSWI